MTADNEVQVDVRVAAGSRRDGLTPAYVVPPAWTDEGVAVDGGGTGALAALLARVDEAAEIPRVVRGEVTVRRR